MPQKALLIILLLTAWVSLVFAADPDNGRMLANSGCRCHGTAELSRFGEDELYTLLLKYKSGEIEHRVMNRHADRYSKQELADIAAYFASK
jgi:cytochrome c553